MKAEITTIPELLIKTYGNMAEVSRYLGCYRATVKKYSKDINAEGHVVINGRLMTTCKTRVKGTSCLAKELDSAVSISKRINAESDGKCSQMNTR
ncbi:hypothetical protein NVI2019_PEGOAJLN_02960 [Providencia alcalifaciens]|uniref:hypothetical protein n=1 Tax=Providencia alcalifaciens TaxID=126385 RepID=UPI0012B5A6FA|nr:hypothetical protein [Providencia alcalifaciens]MTB31644.1 hypothetical protein [Providencia alcalifaciens]MTC36992.1 hypothetical protein [Providencia alcalifaciens]MTC39840.1 hypothetical protein [Providencia alcalifaciens]MTC97184.1 hypothetical protein [Providencia alcalifaciens]CAG9429040.1 hypothetical protein NVI2019_PEGOAJLN_02960 [Providencia alcalifaciens]